MFHKKYLLLAGLCAAIALPATAQESQNTSNSGTTTSGRDMTYRGESYDVLDSNYVTGSRMKQHRKFLNHQTNFPAKPRNMWELGIAGGLYNIAGDVPTLMLWQKGGGAFSLHARKALGYVISLRLDYNYGIGKGLGWQPATAYANNPALNGTNANGVGYGGSPVFYNYKAEVHQLNLDIVVSMGNILFHKAKPKVDPYAFVGIGGNAYQTWVNATHNVGGTETTYATEYNDIIAKYSAGGASLTKGDRKDIKKDLQDLMDDSYETGAENDLSRRPAIFKSKTLSFVTSFGAGIQFRLSKRINLALEDRITFFPTTNEDLLDGQRWTEGVNGAPTRSQSKDGINYASVGLNFNLGGSSRNVEPLYWLNPLDYAYGELSSPRHMIIPESPLADTDGDGIADQLDKCPGTPAGVAVDAHGCPMDTDGDGVPDDRDKQLITPTECQPVDADGVGKCPCNCPVGVGRACGNIGAGSLMFANGSSKISPSMQAQLANLAAQMQANPDCKVVIMGSGSSSKMAQQRSWDRVNAVIEYMSEKNNIDRNHFIFRYDGANGDDNAVMYRSANEGEEGPNNVPPPHPNLRRD